MLDFLIGVPAAEREIRGALTAPEISSLWASLGVQSPPIVRNNRSRSPRQVNLWPEGPLHVGKGSRQTRAVPLVDCLALAAHPIKRQGEGNLVVFLFSSGDVSGLFQSWNGGKIFTDPVIGLVFMRACLHAAKPGHSTVTDFVLGRLIFRSWACSWYTAGEGGGLAPPLGRLPSD